MSATIPKQFLQELTRERGLLRFITAGSVDDGKSTLIGRLLFDSKGIFCRPAGRDIARQAPAHHRRHD